LAELEYFITIPTTITSAPKESVSNFWNRSTEVIQKSVAHPTNGGVIEDFTRVRPMEVPVLSPQHKEFTSSNNVEKIQEKTLRVEIEELRKKLRALKNPSPWNSLELSYLFPGGS